MEFRKDKTVTAIALTLILFASLLMTTISTVAAKDVTTYPYLSVNPNPVGVDQTVTVITWVQPLPPTGFDVYHDLTTTITKPDGTTEVIGPYDTSTIASQYFVYTPTMLGTYRLQMNYPGETFPSGATHLPSQSPVTELIVQEDPIVAPPETPLPDGYWERPINARNREWWKISGDWLMRGYNSTYQVASHSDAAQAFNPYSQAPRSAHIMWAKELGLGGLVGGEFGTTAYYAGHTYEEKLTPPVIMNGKIYRRIYPSDFGIGQAAGGQWPGTICEDLRTGEEIWRNDDMHVDQGQLYNHVSPNQMGTIPYLWDLGTGAAFGLFAGLFPRDVYKMYDANTGELVVTFENVTAVPPHGYSMTMYDDDGTLLVYTLIGPANQMILWNSTKALEGAGLIVPPHLLDATFIRNFRGTHDWSLGIQWVKPIPDRSVMGPAGPVWPAIGGITGNVIVAAVETTAESFLQIGYDATTGEELWVHDAPTYFFRRVLGEGIFASWTFNTMQWYGYDAQTGNQLWVSDPADYPWGVYGFSGVIAYGKLYGINFDGRVHVFDIANGKELFNYFSGNAGIVTPYGSWPIYWGPIIADGVVFAANGEHSPTQPLYRGTKLHAFDANNGAPIWNISGWWAMQAIADGYLITSNAEDNRMYVFGKGPSATTVSVATDVVRSGQSVLIQGTITDQSSGQVGSPAISDEDMAAWMEYMYLSQPKPENANGVPVKLTAVRSDGRTFNIGTATSNEDGVFKMLWQPSYTGEYDIVAEFEGTESYGSSRASTGLGVLNPYGTTGGIAAEPLDNAATAQTTIDLTIILAALIVAVTTIAISIILRKKK